MNSGRTCSGGKTSRRATLALYVPPRRPLRGHSPPWSPPIDDPELAKTIYHEASHAAVTLTTTITGPYLVTIRPGDDDRLGEVRVKIVAPRNAYEAATDLAYKLAGRVAEYLWFDECHPDELMGIGCMGDRDVIEAEHLAETWFDDPEHAWRIVTEGTRRFLSERPQRIVLGRLAQQLHLHQTLDRDALRRLVPTRNNEMPWKLAKWLELAELGP